VDLAKLTVVGGNAYSGVQQLVSIAQSVWRSLEDFNIGILKFLLDLYHLESREQTWHATQPKGYELKTLIIQRIKEVIPSALPICF